MFRKRVKKTFPPGTFIPTPARVFAILQLCLVFSILLWHASKPYMGEHFSVKSQMLVYQHAMGFKDEANRTRFQALPEAEQNFLLKNYHILQKRLEQSYFVKLKRSFQAVFQAISPLELAWLAFSTVLSILILKRVEGAAEALWILPLLAAAYAFDNRYYGVPRETTREEALFPNEQYLIQRYLDEPLKSHSIGQIEQLKSAWNRYLVKEWTLGGNGTPEEGLFRFNVKRAYALAQTADLPTRQTQDPLLALALYIFWNLSYALVAGKAIRRENRQWTKSPSIPYKSHP